MNVPDVVKRLVGVDFEEPTEINKLRLMQNNPYIDNALGEPYIGDYNVLQLQIDNETKRLIDRGFVPAKLSEEEKQAVFKEFETQLEMNL